MMNMKKLVSLSLASMLFIGSAFADATTTTSLDDSSDEIVVTASVSATAIPVIPDGTFSASTVDFTANQVYPVYSAPSNKSIRGANNRALVSTNDWIQVFGADGDWILVQYSISSSHYRIGYIYKNALPDGTIVDDLALTSVPAVVNYDVEVTDDPLVSQKKLASVAENTKVTCLGTMGDWSYIESTEDGKTFRGFVPTDCLSGTVTSMLEAKAALNGSWKLYAGSAVVADSITFAADGTMIGKSTVNGITTEWNGTWSLESYDAARDRYWNDPEFELTLSHDGTMQLFGLRICRRPGENGSTYSYALILSDGEKSSVLCE